jgi:hypothetical protein
LWGVGRIVENSGELAAFNPTCNDRNSPLANCHPRSPRTSAPAPEDPEDPEDPGDPEGKLLVGVSYSTTGPRGRHLVVTVAVAGDEGPVSGADVEATLVNWTLDRSWDYSGTTGGDGTVTFRRNNAPSGEYTLEIDDVFHPEYDEWDSDYEDLGFEVE